MLIVFAADKAVNTVKWTWLNKKNDQNVEAQKTMKKSPVMTLAPEKSVVALYKCWEGFER